MWQGFDPELLRQLATIKLLTSLRHQTPTDEWPLFYAAEHDTLLVVRKWPNGEITAFMTADLTASGGPDRRG